MSEIKVNSITSRDGNNGPVVAGVSTVASSGFTIMPSGDTAVRGSGSGRAVVVLGATPSGVDTMDYFNIATTGDAVDFGNARTARYQNGFGGMASASRGVFQGGASPSVDIIEYVTISSMGGANDFGDHHRGITNANGQCANGTRGLLAGGYLAPTPFGTIDFITIATTGNTADYGEFDDGSTGGYSPMSSSTRAVFARAGQNINYINYTSGGKTQIFGDMKPDSRTGHVASCSNSTRGIMAGGEAPSRVNTITYITISTLGNGIDFGDLTTVRNDHDAVASQTRGCVVAGSPGPGSITNLIDFVTIASTGDATDFGDLTQARTQPLAFSDVHGGLG
tara:strand:+ start:827 stop:1837 length:1011 start_codon:yes stop_codon:yes gene_type:complete